VKSAATAAPTTPEWGPTIRTISPPSTPQNARAVTTSARTKRPSDHFRILWDFNGLQAGIFPLVSAET
jgi:hypothetical protein